MIPKIHLPKLLLLAVTFFGLLFCACQPLCQSGRPIAVALLYNVSPSAGENGKPGTDKAEVDELMAILQERGGVLAFLEFDPRRAFGLLLPVQIEARSEELQEGARTTQKKHTPLSYSSGEELNIPETLFADPLAAEFHRITVFFSDGKNSCDPVPALPKAVETVVITLGVPAELARDLFGAEVHIFLSLQAAIAHINSASTPALSTTPLK